MSAATLMNTKSPTLNISTKSNKSNKPNSSDKPSIKLNINSVKSVKFGTEYHINAENYQRYESTRDHIYNITDTYAGSDEKIGREERTLNLESNIFQEETIELPEAVERIFVEISSNAGDNVARSLRNNVDPKEVEITMTKTTICVRNGGIPIPIEIHPKEKIWAPQLIFGVLHSSSNYDKSKVRTECGRNGYGAKLTNIFSKQFMVTIGDHHNKKWYRQVWNNNMTIMSEPEIKDYDGESFVEVVYVMDFERFKYAEYPEEAFRLFARHAADMSFTGKVPVSFNGRKFHVQDAREYAKLYLGNDAVKNSILYYEWPPGTETIEKKGTFYSKDKGYVPKVEICAVDTPDNALIVSFANGMWTRDGGVHADEAFRAVTTSVLNAVNGVPKDKKKKKKESKKGITLKLGDVKRHISLFVSFWLEDPKFDGQSKKMLRHPKPKIDIDEKLLQPIMKWDLVARLYAELDAKQFRLLSKSDGKKRRNVNVAKGENANKAGTNESENCTLYITEGNSAMGYAVNAISLMENGRDYIGVYPMKGKPLNVMNAPHDQIAKNQEIIDLKEMLGLREGVNYLENLNFATLRYGHILIMADADTDGKHILGLILNLFHCRYPSLLARGYVKYLRTKIIDVTKGKGKNKKKIKFYSQHEYDVWMKNTSDYQSWEHGYFKGLGSSDRDDVAEEFESPKVVVTLYDDLAPTALSLAFHNKLSNQRKDWIANWQPDFKVEEMIIQPISAFINHEFIQFSIADTARSIPRFMDGLKVSQRKVIWGAMKKFKGKFENFKKIKVGVLGSFISSETGYHHDEKILSDVIIHMANDYVGSNNLPYFTRKGQFGCVDPKTPILLWSGDIIKAEDVKVGDELIGDDGKKRTVSNIVSGIDDMYEISQTHGDPYIVNSIHILTLIVTSHKKISWFDHSKSWSIQYYDHSEKKVKNKSVRTSELKTACDGHYNKSKISKEEGYKIIKDFADTISDDNTFDISLNDYLELSNHQKNFMYGFSNQNVVQWDKQDVPIDPYIFGLWLGDGDLCGRGFTTIDPEIVKRYCLWADTIDAEIVHHKNTGAKTYHYGIRRKGSGSLLAIGDPTHSSSTCVGCQSSKNICSVCDWTNENFVRTKSTDKSNPYIKILKDNNLHRNKHIPNCYIQNDESTRLAVLAGFIDTDGTLRTHSNSKGYHFEISQNGEIHGHILESAKIIATSLGFKTSIYSSKNGMKTLMISGDNIHRIPTLVPKKKISKNVLACNPCVSKIKVKKLGKGSYCGWHIDSNERFLLGDGTVTHNTRNMLSKDAAAARYSHTTPEWWWSYIFKKDDNKLLDIIVDEGMECEPVHLLPIIPLQLINGAHGIGTGHSTFIPQYDPMDICLWLIAKIKDQSLPALLPWYRGFKGNISIIDRKKRRNVKKSEVDENDEYQDSEQFSEQFSDQHSPENGTNEPSEESDDDILGPDEIGISKNTKYSMITEGKFEMGGRRKTTVIINELPIGIAIHNYKNWLEIQRENKVITRFEQQSRGSADDVYFEIYGMKNPSIRKLRLQRSFGLSNMVLLDRDNRPIRYDSVSEMMDSFYNLRLPYYQKRKELLLSEIQIRLKFLENKVKFIMTIIKSQEFIRKFPNADIKQAVENKCMLVIGKNKSQIAPQMEALGFDIELLKKVSLHNCTEEEMKSSQDELSSLINDKENIEKTLPKEMWLSDLDDFLKAYSKYYKCKIKSNKLSLNLLKSK